MQTTQNQGFVKSFSFCYDDYNRFVSEGKGNKYFRLQIFGQEDYLWFNTLNPQSKEWIKGIILCYHQKKVLHFSHQSETKEILTLKI